MGAAAGGPDACQNVRVISGRATAAGSARFAQRYPTPRAHGFFRASQGLSLSGIGLGTYLGAMDETASCGYQEAIQAAVRGGINVLDTAINYRHQQSERDLGLALEHLMQSGAARRDELLICSKAGYLTPGAIPPETQTAHELAGGSHSIHPDFLESQIGFSLANLGLETLDVYYLHNPETQLRFVSTGEFDRRVARAFAHLEKEVQRGRIACYGVATWDGLRKKADESGRLSLRRLVDLAREAGGDDHHFRFIQLPVNLAMPEAFTRAHDTDRGTPVSVLEIAARAGITAVGSAALLQGRLAEDGLPDELYRKLPGPRTAAELALQFARSTPGLTTALVGMGQAGHVARNLALCGFPPATVEQYLSLFERES